MRPLDLFAVMGPLTPISDLGLTRDRNAVLERVNKRAGPAGRLRAAAKRDRGGAHAAGRGRPHPHSRAGELSALESLAVHLGGLREGRKSILFVSQGPPMLRGGSDLYRRPAAK